MKKLVVVLALAFATPAWAQNCLTGSGQTFCVPDVTTPGLLDAKMSRLNEVDLLYVEQASAGEGVTTGAVVSAQVTPDMTVAVSAGQVFIGGALATVAAGNLTVTSPNQFSPRWDLISVNSSGTKGVTAGTPASSPRPPSLPAASVPLALVWVQPGSTTVTSGVIVPKRFLVQPQNTTVAVTASPRSVTAAESGTTFTNEGAGGAVVFNLPTAAVGLCYRFHVHSAQTVTITAGGGDSFHIDYQMLAGGSSVSSNVSGESIQICGSSAHWHTIAHSGTTFGRPSKSLPDNSATDIFSVVLPTSNTGCTVHTSFTYTVTNGTTQAQTHSGIYIWAFVNQNGTVSGAATDSGEAVVGTGCGAGCDSASVGIAGTTATARWTFNNTFSVNGLVSYTILNNSCGTITVIP